MVTGHEQSAARALAAACEGDGRQRALRAAQPGDAALIDRDPSRAQPLGILCVEFGGPVGEQRHVVAPEAQQERPLHTWGTPVEHSERLVADLPSVAERAVEHRAAPPLHDPRERGEAVIHPRGEQHAPRQLARAVGQLEQEPRVVLLAAQDLNEDRSDNPDEIKAHVTLTPIVATATEAESNVRTLTA